VIVAGICLPFTGAGSHDGVTALVKKKILGVLPVTSGRRASLFVERHYSPPAGFLMKGAAAERSPTSEKGDTDMLTISPRQIISIALLSALLAVAGTSTVFFWNSRIPAVRAANEADAPSNRKTPRAARVSDPSTTSDERNNIEVYRAIAPGVVFITAVSAGKGFFDDRERSGTGSGSIIDKQGHILTSEHVVEGAARLMVKLGDGKDYPARVVGADPNTDLAVIKVEAPADQLTVIRMADSDQLQVGQKVLAIGNPFGLDRTLTTGVISGLQRPIHAGNGRLIEGAIQTDASINPGNSGGPLLDSQGRMIGINSRILSPRGGGSVGVGFAIPAKIAMRIVPQLISVGRVVQPRLGIGVRAVSDLRGQVRLPVEEGLLVMQVAPGSAAEQAGLRGFSRDEYGDIALGDIILAVDGEAVRDQNDLTRILERKQIGETIQVRVWRDGRERTISIALTAPRPVRRKF
jgi:S1-C subfamily serine protease